MTRESRLRQFILCWPLWSNSKTTDAAIRDRASFMMRHLSRVYLLYCFALWPRCPASVWFSVCGMCALRLLFLLRLFLSGILERRQVVRFAQMVMRWASARKRKHFHLPVHKHGANLELRVKSKLLRKLICHQVKIYAQKKKKNVSMLHVVGRWAFPSSGESTWNLFVQRACECARTHTVWWTCLVLSGSAEIAGIDSAQLTPHVSHTQPKITQQRPGEAVK